MTQSGTLFQRPSSEKSTDVVECSVAAALCASWPAPLRFAESHSTPVALKNGKLKPDLKVMLELPLISMDCRHAAMLLQSMDLFPKVHGLSVFPRGPLTLELAGSCEDCLLLEQAHAQRQREA